MSLAATIDEINRLKPFAEENTDEGPIETLAGRRGRKVQAMDRMVQLRRQYYAELLSSAVFIVASGANKDAFVQLATEKFGCFTADPDQFFTDLANRLPPVLFNGTSSVENIFTVLGRHVEDKAIELGLAELNMPVFKQEYRVNFQTKAEILPWIKQIVCDQIGAEIVGFQAVNSIMNQAIERGHKEVLTPIVLPSDDEKLVSFLVKDFQRRGRSHKVFLVAAGKTKKEIRSIEGALSVKEPTEDSVKQALVGIRSSFRK